ncbi:MAG: hypothetical protein ACK4KW_04535 [Gemmobacter sp.]
MTEHELDGGLESLLVTLRADLLTGRLDRLDRLAEAIERATAEAEAAPPPVEALRRIRRLADGITAPAEAAMRGIRAARLRVAEIAAARQGFAPYGIDGQRRALPPTGPADPRRV